MQVVFSIGFIVIGLAFGYSIYLSLIDHKHAFLAGVYAFGFIALAGIFGAYPLGGKKKNEFGDRLKDGRSLSSFQVLIFLFWLLGFGAYLVYLVEC